MKMKKGVLAVLIMLVTNLTPSIAHAESGPAALAQRMLQRAEIIGNVESMEIVDSTFNEARVAIDPLYVPDSDTSAEATLPVQVVVMHGRFTDTLAKVPEKDPDPVGSVTTFTVNAAGRVIETYVGNHQPQLGAAIYTMQPNVATATKSIHARTSRHHYPRRSVAEVATWGDHCKGGGDEEQHCYALARWSMGPGEYIYGSSTIQVTNSVDVPGWEYGYFVDNEEWLGFKNSPVGNPYWTEMGQTGGNGISCCSIYSFFAYQNHSGYHEVEGPEKSLGAENVYTMRSVGGGVWCFYIGNVEQYKQGCEEGFEEVTKDAEVGAEMADESQPSNAGYAETDWLNPNKEAFQWDKAVNELDQYELGRVSYNGMCVAQYTPWNWPGNIYYGSYGNCP